MTANSPGYSGNSAGYPGGVNASFDFAISHLGQQLASLVPGSFDFQVVSAELNAVVAEKEAALNPSAESFAAAESARAHSEQMQGALTQSDAAQSNSPSGAAQAGVGTNVGRAATENADGGVKGLADAVERSVREGTMPSQDDIDGAARGIERDKDLSKGLRDFGFGYGFNGLEGTAPRGGILGRLGGPDDGDDGREVSIGNAFSGIESSSPGSTSSAMGSLGLLGDPSAMDADIAAQIGREMSANEMESAAGASELAAMNGTLDADTAIGLGLGRANALAGFADVAGKVGFGSNPGFAGAVERSAASGSNAFAGGYAADPAMSSSQNGSSQSKGFSDADVAVSGFGDFSGISFGGHTEGDRSFGPGIAGAVGELDSQNSFGSGTFGSFGNAFGDGTAFGGASLGNLASASDDSGIGYGTSGFGGIALGDVASGNAGYQGAGFATGFGNFGASTAGYGDGDGYSQSGEGQAMTDFGGDGYGSSTSTSGAASAFDADTDMTGGFGSAATAIDGGWGSREGQGWGASYGGVGEGYGINTSGSSPGMVDFGGGREGGSSGGGRGIGGSRDGERSRGAVAGWDNSSMGGWGGWGGGWGTIDFGGNAFDLGGIDLGVGGNQR